MNHAIPGTSFHYYIVSTALTHAIANLRPKTCLKQKGDTYYCKGPIGRLFSEPTNRRRRERGAVASSGRHPC